MELYTLDPLLRRQDVIDKFETLIWTERFKEYGDFELHILSTVQSRSLFKPGTRLAMNKSFRVMMIKTAEDGLDEEGKHILVVKGFTLEAMLLDRVAKDSLSDLTTSPQWVITDAPLDIARKVFHDICVTGILDPLDVIPFVVEDHFLPDSNIEEPADDITALIDPTTVYDAIKGIADVWNFGFRLLRYFDTSQLYFDVYTGRDLTTAQTTLPAVVFAPELDNLQNTKELISTEAYKNVAYVFSPAGFEMVYGIGVDPEVEGFERSVLMVSATDITTDNPDVSAALIQRGQEALANSQVYQAFDGEISQNSQYKYGTDYELGDLVEQRNDDGVTNFMRVTEQIFVSDSEGEREYPTLTLGSFITVGSWGAEGVKVWTDYTTEHWDELP